MSHKLPDAEPFWEVLDWSSVQRKVREFAALAPDYTYNTESPGGCVYWPDPTNPLGCIVGAALTDLGFDVETAFTDRDDQFDHGDVIDAQIHCLLGTPDWETMNWLGIVQKAQDNGLTWGESVIQADTSSEWNLKRDPLNDGDLFLSNTEYADLWETPSHEV